MLTMHVSRINKLELGSNKAANANSATKILQALDSNAGGSKSSLAISE